VSGRVAFCTYSRSNFVTYCFKKIVAVKFFMFMCCWPVWYCLLIPVTGNSQLQNASSSSVQPTNLQKGLFDSDDVLNIKLSGNIRAVLNDRGNDPQYHPLDFSWFTKDSSEVSMLMNIKTRGHFRRDKANCDYPPLMLDLSKSNQPSSSLFYKQNKLKLVMPCREDGYVIREWLVYKLYNLITPKSFRARLVRVTLDDIPKKKKTTFYGILLEDRKQMAERNHLVPVEKKLLKPQNTETDAFLIMAVFEYMIGNTDWSVQYMQNIKLLAADPSGIPVTVPYDFDHSGMVDAPYAHPAEELEMRSVMERRYRGYCITDIKRFDDVIALFNRLKKDFYAIYTNCSLLDAKYVKTITKYLDEFYSTINNPKDLKTAFSYPCNSNGTGNIIIKGLKEN